MMDGLELFNACLVAASWSGAPFCVENPVGVISTHVRKPDHTFDPCDYAELADDPKGDSYTKETCLWVGNGFVMPPKAWAEPTLGSLMHTMSGGPDNKRSVTPMGFARAVFEANNPSERSKA